MPDASFVQTSFLAGEWSPYAQGRMDLPQYRQAMAVCLNAIPVEEGAAPRRPGFAFAATTRNGNKGRLLPFNFTDQAPYSVELTDGYLRVFTGLGLVFTDDVQTLVNISTDNPAIVTVGGSVSWATGDAVQILFQNAQNSADGAILRNRQFTITLLAGSTTQFTIADPVTGTAVDGSTVNWNPGQDAAQVGHVLELVSPYTSGSWAAVKYVQAAAVGPNQSNVLLLLQSAIPPQSLEATANANGADLAAFTLAQQDFADGPYLDPVPGLQITPNAASGSIVLTAAYASWSSTTAYTLGDVVESGGSNYECIVEASLNSTPPSTDWALVTTPVFVATDVGRSVRLFSEPAAWSSSTPYSVGDNVGYNGTYYQCIVANTGDEPDTNLTSWLVTSSTGVATWSWGKIVTYTSSLQVTIMLLGPPLLYVAAIPTWQLGVYGATLGYPTCGAFYEGRLWLGGVLPNRVDSSNSDDFYNFAPTASDGTVGDANSISAIFNSNDLAKTFWMEPTTQGLICGTLNGEWLLQASSLQDPLTPTSIQAHRQTRVGCADILPIHTPLTLVFVQKFNRMLFEYFPDVFSGKLSAPNLNVYSKHLTVSNVEELAYQSELAPVVWARTGIGQLVGWTYRRVSLFASEEPKFVAAHQHVLGSGRVVESLITGPDRDNTLDTVGIVSNDESSIGASGGVRHVEFMTPLMDPSDPLTDAWFVDDAVTPSGMITSATGVTLYGLWHLNGSTVSAVIGGLDCGDHLVAAGSMFVPWLSDPGQLFTLSFLQTLAASGASFGDFATFLDTTATVAAGVATTPQIVQQIVYYTKNFSGARTDQATVDWGNNILYLQENGSGAAGTGGVRVISLGSGVETLSATLASILGTGAQTSGLGGPMVLGSDGNLYWYASSSNQGVMVKVEASTLALLGTFGVSGTATIPGTNGFCGLRAGTGVYAGANFVVGLSNDGTTSYFQVMNTDTMTWPTGLTATEMQIVGSAGEDDCSICAGQQSSNGASVYAAQLSNNSGSVAYGYIYTGALSLAGILTISYVKIVPSVIDPSWSGFTGSCGIIYDGTDGCVIVGVNNSNALNTQNYIVKIRPADGSIVWVSPVAGLPVSFMFSQSKVTNGVLTILTGGAPTGSSFCYSIQTNTGAVVKFAVVGIYAADASASTDSSGRLVFYAGTVSFSETGATISPAVGTPTSWGGGWGIFTPGDIGQGAGTSNSRITIPAVVGFTYTSQGQILRPAAPQDAGTANGPGFGKTHRQHMFGLLLAGAIYGAISVGTLFTKLRPCNFKNEAGVPYATNTLFSGLHWNTLEDNYSFDSQLCWQVTRPLPGNVVSIGGFINTQDR